MTCLAGLWSATSQGSQSRLESMEEECRRLPNKKQRLNLCKGVYQHFSPQDRQAMMNIMFNHALHW